MGYDDLLTGYQTSRGSDQLHNHFFWKGTSVFLCYRGGKKNPGAVWWGEGEGEKLKMNAVGNLHIFYLGSRRERRKSSLQNAWFWWHYGRGSLVFCN